MFFGTNALLQIDLNLSLQIIAFLILLIGYAYKRKDKFKIHGSFMAMAVILQALSFTLIMGPVFFGYLEFFTTETNNLGVQTTLLHAITGAIVLILGTGTIVAWALRPSDIGACRRRKRIMDAIILLWLASLTFGICTYLILYL